MEKDDQLTAPEIDQLTAKLWDIEIMAGGIGLQIEPQLTTHPVIIVLLNGVGTLKRDDAVMRMKAETVYIAPADSTFGFEGGKSADCAVAVIRFGLYRESRQSRSKLHVERTKAVVSPLDGASLATAGRLGGLCRTMKEQQASGDPLVRWRAQQTFQELLYETFAAVRRRPKLDSREALEHAKAYMDEHYGDELTIEMLAGMTELSPKYFVDLFKRQYGVSALDYLTQVRMGKAKRLMLASDMRLKDIAHEVGYEDEFYFSRKFRKTVGVAPSAFVKKRRNRIAVYGSASLLGYLMPLQVVPYAAPIHPKWAGFYHERLGADIAVHLNAYRHNYYKSANLDKLEQAKPELILCPPGLDASEKARLTGLAELFELPQEHVGWRARLHALAERLGEQAEAERWIETFERKVSRVRTSLGIEQRRPVVLTVRVLKNKFYAHCSKGMSDVLFEGIGAAFPIEDASVPFDRLMSLDELDAVQADLLLLLICQETETLDGWKELKQSPRWLSMRAVREDKVRLIPSEPWREYSPIALERMLEQSERLLSGKRP